ncbi:ATP-binding protein [Actinomadura sp. 6N118]|uniref:ATP-binding protein n=1 Tax=Actinomadura sp. 6N118 TaxID=3375151 RepID=UPI003789D79D
MSERHTMTIEAHAHALKLAREWVGEIFETWSIDPYLGKLIVSELAGNVLKHTDTDQMTVRLYWADRGPVIEVEDSSPDLPVVHEMSPDKLDGRGLAMIQLLAADLGWNVTSGGGKCVYAVLPGVAA